MLNGSQLSKSKNNTTSSQLTRFEVFKKKVIRDRPLLLLSLLPFLYIIIFHYVPMYGVIIAFKNYSPGKGILGSAWVGFKYFIQFFHSFYFFRLIKNTLLLSIFNLVFSFPIPLLFALMLNEVKSTAYKRIVQTVSYLPHFISTVIIVGIMYNFLAPNDGIVNIILQKLGHKNVNFMAEASWFRTLYISSGIWAEFGFGSIIYIAAITGINPELYDAADVDGCSRLRKIWHITLPGIAQTVIILLLLRLGHLMSVGFEKIILMYSPVIYDVSDVISTYVYRNGVVEGNYSFSTAIGLFNSVVNLVFLMIFNKVSKKVSEVGLW